MLYAVVLKDLLFEDARYLTNAYGCDLIHDQLGQYLAISSHEDQIAALEIEAKDFFFLGKESTR